MSGIAQDWRLPEAAGDAVIANLKNAIALLHGQRRDNHLKAAEYRSLLEALDVADKILQTRIDRTQQALDRLREREHEIASLRKEIDNIRKRLSEYTSIIDDESSGRRKAEARIRELLKSGLKSRAQKKPKRKAQRRNKGRLP